MSHPAAVPPASLEVVKEIILSSEEILSKVAELGAEITLDFEGRELCVAGILQGAWTFTSDLVREIQLPLEVDFVSISRYKRVPGFEEVTLIKDLEYEIEGKDLLLVEDIVDTGLTLNHLVEVFREREPRSISICSLLDRPVLRLADIPLKYVGFDVNEEFLIGYGLDYRENYRNLPFIATMDI